MKEKDQKLKEINHLTQMEGQEENQTIPETPKPVPTGGSSEESRRFDSLDMLRGFCIFFMIFNHSFIYLGGHAAEGVFGFIMIEGFTWLVSASTFLTVAGMANGFSAIKREKTGNPLPYLRYLVRGIYLIVLALYVSGAGSLVSETSEFFNYDILYIMGFIALAIPVINSFNNQALFTVSAILIICTPLIRRQSNFLEPWSGVEGIDLVNNVTGIHFWATCGGEFHWTKDFRSFFEGGVYAGFFPIFPYAAFFLIGIYLARQLDNGELDKNTGFYVVFGSATVLIGIILAIIGGTIKGSVENSHAWFGTPLIYYPVSFSHLICQLGSLFIMIVIFHKIFDSNSINNFFVDAIRITGRFSLSFYVYSYTFIYGTVYISHLISGKPLEEVYGSLIPGFWPALYAISCWALLSFVLIPLSLKFGGIGTLEHLMGVAQGEKSCSNKEDA